jgi:hypothetical protein
MVKPKGQSVTIPAPVLMIPDGNDKPVPVWTDKGEWIQNLIKQLHYSKWPYKNIKYGEGQLTIRFMDKDHAIMFCLSYEGKEYETQT